MYAVARARTQGCGRLLAIILVLSLLDNSYSQSDGPPLETPDEPVPAPSGSVKPIPGRYIVIMGSKPPVVSGEVGRYFRKAYPTRRGAAHAAARAAAGVTDDKDPLKDVTPRQAAAVADAYAAQLLRDQEDVISGVLGVSPEAARATGSGAGAGGVRLVYQYTVAANGFTVSGLSEDQAAALRRDGRVWSVTPDELGVFPATITTPEYLGLGGSGGGPSEGLWWDGDYFGSPDDAGKDVLIGMVDTGIDQHGASFAPRANASDPLELWPSLGANSSSCPEAGTCNVNKVIGCLKYDDGFAQSLQGAESRPPWDVGTCKDTHGHGTHTAGTAAGGRGAPAGVSDRAAPYNAGPLCKAGMSGVAPGASLASYKVLWYYLDSDGKLKNSGAYSDVVKALDQMVKDGADVINYSVGSNPPAFWFSSPVGEAFLNAASAGVFVSAAGGNSGGGAGTVTNGLPWVTTVAAGSHAREDSSSGFVSVGVSGSIYRGDMLALDPVGPAPLYLPTEAADKVNATLCYNATLDASKVAGKIVICRRGTIPMVDKSREVLRAGGAGMVLINVEGGATDTRALDHSVPTVHLASEAGAALVAVYLAAGPSPPSASLSGRRFDNLREAPTIAYFSGRGPSVTDGAALLKPDITAPGVNVVAAKAKTPQLAANDTDTASLLSGTSMATPHVAGVAAMMRTKYPDWTPAAIRSAMMTTADRATNRGNPIPQAQTADISVSGEASPFDYGSGQVNPRRALDPGLVYDAKEADYKRYICSQLTDPAAQSAEGFPGYPQYCDDLCSPSSACFYPQGVRDFNYPSFSLAGVNRGSTVRARRRITWVSPRRDAGERVNFTAVVSLPEGFRASVLVDKKPDAAQQPSSSYLQFFGMGESRTFTLSVNAGTAVADGWHFGSLTWNDGKGMYSVRSEIAVQVTSTAARRGKFRRSRGRSGA